MLFFIKSESYRTRRLSKTFCIPSQHGTEEKDKKKRFAEIYGRT